LSTPSLGTSVNIIEKSREGSVSPRGLNYFNESKGFFTPGKNYYRIKYYFREIIPRVNFLTPGREERLSLRREIIPPPGTIPK